MGCLTINIARIGGGHISRRRIGGISATAEREGGISVRASLVCTTDIGSNIFLLAAGDGSALITMDNGFLAFKQRTI